MHKAKHWSASLSKPFYSHQQRHPSTTRGLKIRIRAFTEYEATALSKWMDTQKIDGPEGAEIEKLEQQ